MNKRQMKKFNKKAINNILDKLVFKTTDRRFGSGYFLFEFEGNSICWFFVNELPDWKFGIWYNRETNTYEIFGQTITLIDKFKPYASPLCETDIEKFNLCLGDIKNKSPEWEEYLEETEQGKLQDKMNDEYNEGNFRRIKEYLAKVEEEFEAGDVQTYIKIVDGNTKHFKVSPRYKLSEFTDIEGYFDTQESRERSIQLYRDLCNCIEYCGNHNGDYTHYIDDETFLFEGEFLKNPKDFEEMSKSYKHKITDFDKHCEQILAFSEEESKNTGGIMVPNNKEIV